jgi:hypothetical protein
MYRHLLTHSSGLGYDFFSECFKVSRKIFADLGRSCTYALPRNAGDHSQSETSKARERGLHLPSPLRTRRRMGIRRGYRLG